MDLVSLTPEGRILLTLAHGQHTYAELKLESGLSDRWLTFKLQKLVDKGFVLKNKRWYSISDTVEVSACELSFYLRRQAQRIAAKLGKLTVVNFVVLFGSVAQKKAHQYSDLDLLIVATGSVEKAKKTVLAEISRVESIFHLTIEPLVFSEQDFLGNVHSKEGGIIFGLADGFEVLLDKTSNLSETLRNRIREIRSTYTHIDEEGIWLRAK